MKTNVAILWETGAPLSVEEAELEAPREGEVLVEMKAAGVCQSDLHPARGDWPMRPPLALGHEGAGIVCEVGANVSRIKAGDHVVLCWAPPCGSCPPCQAGHPVLCDRLEKTTFRNRMPAGGTRLRARDREIFHLNSTACFADFAVISEDGAIPVRADVSFAALATLGCAVVTGFGAVMNAAQVKTGSNVVVIGAGGVGLNVIQAAKIIGCEKIIAVDRHTKPLELAREFGATHVLESLGDNAKQVRELTNERGADYVFDTVGAQETIAEALKFARKGGAVVVTGLFRTDGQATIATFPFVMHEKRLVGSLYGSGQPLADIPKLIELYRNRELKLDELVTRTYRLDEVNEALAALAAAAGARGIIRW